MVCTPVPIVILVRDEQPLKADSPIEETKSPMVTDFSETQFLNVSKGMLVKPSPMTTVSSLLHSSKAP